MLCHRMSVLAEARQRFGGIWLFAYVFLLQLGHLVEHISVAIQGQGLLGSSFDSELSHLLFNGGIAVLATTLLFVYTRNPWVYPLFVISVLHECEHIYIYHQYMETGLTGGPGLLGLGGVIGVFPSPRVQMHNIYNGIEVILLMLGFMYQTEVLLTHSRARGVATP
jgi:hypothetical protein